MTTQTEDLVAALKMSLGQPVNNADVSLPSPLDHVRDGAIFIVERKTSGEDITQGSTFWSRKTLDLQPTMYLAAEPAAEFVLYDVIRKPESEPHKATPIEKRKYTKPTKADPASRLYSNQREFDETPAEYFARLCDDIASRPDWYFQRGIVVRLEHESEMAATNLWHVTQEILFARRASIWPQSPSSCFDFGHRCEFHDVCAGTASLDDEARYETRDGKTHLPMLSSSALGTWGACHRKYYYAYELRRRPRTKTSAALTFGTRFHEALEAWSTDGLNAALGHLLSGVYDYDTAKAHALLLGYHARWIGEPVRFVSVESEFVAPLIDPITGAVSEHFVLGGTIDGVAVKEDVEKE